MAKMSLREAGQTIGSTLYGENVEISELQLLFSLTELHRMKKEITKYPECDFLNDIVIDIDQVAADLEAEIDRKMPESSENRPKYLAMKAFSLNLRGSNATMGVLPDEPNEIRFRPEYCEQSVALLEDIKLDKVAVYFYVDALNTLGTCFLFPEPRKAVDYLTKAEKTYEEFLRKMSDVSEAFTPYKLFEVTREIKTLWCLLMAHHYTSVFLYAAYTNLKDNAMKLRYAMPSIRAKISIDMSENNGVYIIKNTMHAMVEEINCLIRNMHFDQVNHLLAAFMNNLVQHRRSLLEARRNEVDFAQSLVSLCYANWAYEVVHWSFLVLTGNDEENLKPVETFYAFDDLLTGEYEVYLDQFSCTQITSSKGLKKAIKRGKQWCERAIEMGGDSQYVLYAKTLIQQFNNLEEDTKFLEKIK